MLKARNVNKLRIWISLNFEIERNFHLEKSLSNKLLFPKKINNIFIRRGSVSIVSSTLD